MNRTTVKLLLAALCLTAACDPWSQQVPAQSESGLSAPPKPNSDPVTPSSELTAAFSSASPAEDDVRPVVVTPSLVVVCVLSSSRAPMAPAIASRLGALFE